jgi:subtilase family serine protease
MRCMAWKRTDIGFRSVSPQATAPPSGYRPADIQAAYNLPSKTAGFFQTIAIVDAYNDPKAESDLAVYRSTFSLPPCTTANGCFLQVNQTGATSPLPTVDPSPCGGPNGCWEEEEALDLDMASAVCPNCHILLVEAKGAAGQPDLYVAEDTAAQKCAATAISNSWNGGEYAGENLDDVHFNHPGIPITFASGDNGYPGGYPTASQFVTAVGGTTLNNAGTGTQSETVWSSTGSLCSAVIPQPLWQSSLAIVKANPTVCTMRIDNDVSAIGDPNTGVAVYTTFGGDPGWMVFGGTSVATPIIAGVYALAGNGASINDGSYSYGHTGSLNDVTSGNNEPCGAPPPVGSYVCDAGTGYDGPTGNGTPNGTGGF